MKGAGRHILALLVPRSCCLFPQPWGLGGAQSAGAQSLRKS